MTKFQAVLITVGSAVGLQIAGQLAGVTEADLADWGQWLFSLGVGALNAVGVAIIALKTTGGLSLGDGGGKG